MQNYAIILTSITYVYKGQRLLGNNGIKAHITRLQPSYDRRGCGYSLEVSGESLQNAVQLLEKNYIRIVEVTPLY